MSYIYIAHYIKHFFVFVLGIILFILGAIRCFITAILNTIIIPPLLSTDER